MAINKIDSLIEAIAEEYLSQLKAGTITTSRKKADWLEKFKKAIGAPKIVFPRSLGAPGAKRGTKPPL